MRFKNFNGTSLFKFSRRKKNQIDGVICLKTPINTYSTTISPLKSMTSDI